MRLSALIFFFVATAYAAPQELKRGHDVAHITDVSVPQPQYQVITAEQVESIYTQKQALDDIKDRLTKIEDSVKDIKADVKTLTETNIIVNFLLGVVKWLVPGLIIAAFTVWYTNYSKKPKPRKPQHA